MKVKQTGQFKYQQTRIKAPTELNISNWRGLCKNYHGQLLLEYLEYGSQYEVSRKDTENHPLAGNFPHDVEMYLHKELQHRGIVGPCHTLPFLVHHLLLLSRPQTDDTSIIVNLSHSEGMSVNSGIRDDVYADRSFLLKYRSDDGLTILTFS